MVSCLKDGVARTLLGEGGEDGYVLAVDSIARRAGIWTVQGTGPSDASAPIRIRTAGRPDTRRARATSRMPDAKVRQPRSPSSRHSQGPSGHCSCGELREDLLPTRTSVLTGEHFHRDNGWETTATVPRVSTRSVAQEGDSKNERRPGQGCRVLASVSREASPQVASPLSGWGCRSA